MQWHTDNDSRPPNHTPPRTSPHPHRTLTVRTAPSPSAPHLTVRTAPHRPHRTSPSAPHLTVRTAPHRPHRTSPSAPHLTVRTAPRRPHRTSPSSPHRTSPSAPHPRRPHGPRPHSPVNPTPSCRRPSAHGARSTLSAKRRALSRRARPRRGRAAPTAASSADASGEQAEGEQRRLTGEPASSPRAASSAAVAGLKRATAWIQPLSRLQRHVHGREEQHDEDGHLDQRAGLFGAQEHRHAAGPQRGDEVHAARRGRRSPISSTPLPTTSIPAISAAIGDHDGRSAASARARRARSRR